MSVIDKGFISKILEFEDLSEAYKYQITSDFFENEERAIWDFIEQFYRQYSSMPTKLIIKEQFDVDVGEVKEPLEFWINGLISRSTYDRVRELVVSLDRKLVDSKPMDALDLIKQFLVEQEKVSIVQAEADAIGNWAEEVSQRYEQAKLGLIGIHTPWLKMDSMTGGWHGGDINVVAARSGIGKSFLTLLMALKAREKKKKVLYFSGEMTEEDIASRTFAIHYKIPYSKMRSGKLLPHEEMRMREHIKDFKRMDDIIVVKAYAGFTTNDVSMTIQTYKPDLVIIDAAYRFKAIQKTRDRFENMAAVTTELKSIAGKHKVPINFSVQLNRASTSKKGGSFGTEDVAMADAIGWEASNLFFLHSNDELKENRQMEIVPVKVRENANYGKPLLINWNFELMDFSELSDFYIPPTRDPKKVDPDSDGF